MKKLECHILLSFGGFAAAETPKVSKIDTTAVNSTSGAKFLNNKF